MIDFYAVLEVSRTSDEATIKKSYRKLVLKWHPDKNPDKHEEAEAKIRAINTAYETLSNPARRSAYEAQAQAVEKKARGVRLDTSGIQPRMSIPKAFMLCPLGHPDRFLRGSGTTLSFDSRDDMKEVGFAEFFDIARFSLWWIPHVNNMCRLQAQLPGTVAMGAIRQGPPPPGLNLSFGLSRGEVSSSDVMLTPVENAACSNLIAVASPFFHGAFRFEAAYFPGHFLAFKPPRTVQMIGEVDSQAVLDFLLMDFTVREMFRSVDEVLVPVVTRLVGVSQPVKVSVVADDMEVRMYFQAATGRRVWNAKEFEIHFHGHWELWQYDSAKQTVKLRSLGERLGFSLSKARSSAEVTNLVLSDTGKAKSELMEVPVDSLQMALQHLCKESVFTSGSPVHISLLGILEALEQRFQGQLRADGLHAGASTRLLKSLQVLAHGSKCQRSAQLASRVQQLVMKALSSLLQDTKSTLVLDRDALIDLCGLELDWQTCGPILAQKAQQVIAQQSLTELVPILRAAATNRIDALGESVATAALMKTFGTDAATAATALEAMSSAGYGTEGIPMTLRLILPSAPLDTVANILAGLVEKGAHGADIEACCEQFNSTLATAGGIESLSTPTLLRLAGLPAPKAAQIGVDTHSAAVKALVARQGGLEPQQVAMFLQALAALPDRAAELADLTKEALTKISDFGPSSLLALLTVVSKDDDSPRLRLLDYIDQVLSEQADSACQERSDIVAARRLELERQGHFLAPDLVSLAKLLLTCRSGSARHSVWDSLARCLLLLPTGALSASSKEALQDVLGGDNGFSAESRHSLQSALAAMSRQRSDNANHARRVSRSRSPRPKHFG